MKRNFSFLILRPSFIGIYFSFVIAFSLYAKSPVDYVDPMIGTTKLGNTYPAVCMPFGLAKFTPQTRSGEVKGDKPYDYQDAAIQGIRWTNFISGSAVPEYASHTFAAMTGDFKVEPKDRASSFSHDNEIAKPHYYSVFLDDYQIQIEVTASTRAGISGPGTGTTRPTIPGTRATCCS